MDEVFAFSDDVWRRCASLLDMDAMKVRSDTLFRLLVAFGFMYREVFDDLKSYPLRLTQGSIAENIRALINDGEEIHDELALRIRRFIKDCGSDPDEAQRSLELLLDMPCSGKLPEEGHASGSVIKKPHPEYSEQLLEIRSAMHARRALTRPTKTEKALDSVDSQLQRLDAKRPQQTRAWQMHYKRFVQDLVDGGINTDHIVIECSRLMGVASSSWKDTPLHERCARQVELQAHVLQKVQDVQNERQRLRAIREQILANVAAETTTVGSTNHLGSMRFSTDDMARIAEVFSSDRVKALRCVAETQAIEDTPRAPSRQQKDIMERMMQSWPLAPPRQRPWFNSTVANNRQLFCKTALAASPDAEACWMFLFAKQNPQESTWLEMRRREPCLRADGGSDDDAEDVGGGAWGAAVFDLFPLRLLKEVDLGVGEEQVVWVILQLRIVGAIVKSYREAVLLDDF